jgi:hypothetical protein
VILFLSTADTEILALRAAIEMLPDSFPPVRAGSPAVLEVAHDLGGVVDGIVRLLGGRVAGELRLAVGELVERISATEALALACGDAALAIPA